MTMLLKNHKKHIVFVGHRGVGKTTVGRLFALRYALDFYDSDEKIISFYGKSISSIFQLYGSFYFRFIEYRVIDLLCSSKNNSVISTGGGAIVLRATRDIITRKAFVIFLDASLDLIAKRMQKDNLRIWSDFISRDKEIRYLFYTRRVFYRKIADFIINTDFYSPKDLVELIFRNCFIN